jgi:hypothetical protein
VEGLQETGHLTGAQPLKVDILKVPHHGSRNNVVDTDLLDRVIASHYIFCGDGHHGNPAVDVVELMAKRRLKAPGRFKFWFNCSGAVVTDRSDAAQMRAVERKVRTLARSSKGRMTFKFLDAGSSLRVI